MIQMNLVNYFILIPTRPFIKYPFKKTIMRFFLFPFYLLEHSRLAMFGIPKLKYMYIFLKVKNLVFYFILFMKK